MERALIKLIKRIKIEPVKVSIDNVWIGFPPGYTERHLAKFQEVNELQQKITELKTNWKHNLEKGGWGCK